MQFLDGGFHLVTFPLEDEVSTGSGIWQKTRIDHYSLVLLWTKKGLKKLKVCKFGDSPSVSGNCKVARAVYTGDRRSNGNNIYYHIDKIIPL